MATKYFATACEFRLYENDWNKGDDKLISLWDEADYIESADTVEDILKQVNYLDCDVFGKKHINRVFENDPCQDKDYGRFDAALIVDIDGENIIKPSEEKRKQFERGEVKLYALYITVYIHKQVDLDEDDVSHFG